MKKFLSLLLVAALILSISVFAAANEPDNTDFVSDAVYYVAGPDMEYHVPQINMDGAGVAALNAVMREELYGQYVFPLEYGDDTSFTGYTALSYVWAVSNDVLSILATAWEVTDCDVYHIYNMSLSTGERMSDTEVFQAFGITREKFNDLVRDALYHSYDRHEDWVDADFLAEQRARSMADENLTLAKPYVGRGGALCAVARQYAVAGAECYDLPLTLIPGDTGSALVSFLERCDKEYLTREDIVDFDADMCYYARNGIFARSGRKFQDKDLQNFFSQYDWYEPAIDPDQFTDAYLNDYQIKNIALIIGYEQSLS